MKGTGLMCTLYKLPISKYRIVYLFPVYRLILHLVTKINDPIIYPPLILSHGKSLKSQAHYSNGYV